MQTITVETIHDITRVTIPRSCFPDANIIITIAVLGSLTSANGPVINTDEYIVFDFDERIPQPILYNVFKRWGINVEGIIRK